MADKAFRDYLPYHKNSETTPQIVTADTPTFELLNELVIGDNLPAGEYVLTASYEWWMADINDSALFRFVSPITIGTVYSQEPRDLSDVVFRTAAAPFTYLGGPITFRFEASTTVGGSVLNVNWSSLEWERKA